MCWRKEAGGGEGEGAADTALKTKTPHDNVGKKKGKDEKGKDGRRKDK